MSISTLLDLPEVLQSEWNTNKEIKIQLSEVARYNFRLLFFTCAMI